MLAKRIIPCLDVTGGRVVAADLDGGDGLFGALSIGGSFNVPFNVDSDDPTFEAAGSITSVSITGSATGWLQADGGVSEGLRVDASIGTMRVTGNVADGGGVTYVLDVEGGVSQFYVDGDLTGDIDAGNTINELIVTGTLSDGGGTVNIDADLDYVYVDGTFTDDLVLSDTSFIGAGQVPGALLLPADLDLADPVAGVSTFSASMESPETS